VGEPLTVKIFADMINSCGFDAVHILSPHSEVTPALLNNVVVHDECELVEEMLRKWITRSISATVNLVCPDAGAGKRVGKVATYLAKRFPQNTINLIRCEKVRDVRDGSLKEFFVQADDLGGHPTLIIDDIVAYGGTFLGLADKLRERNCGDLGIFVSHADCETGLNNLRIKFDAVVTTDSKRDYAGYGLDNDSIVKIIPFKIKTA
jgi:ribose-phosphate pyrophosphokinase